MLEDCLEDCRGCVVVVSHDRYFLDRTVDRLFSFENSELHRFEGNYSAYLERQAALASPKGPVVGVKAPAAVAAASPAEPPAPLPRSTAAAKPVRKRSFKESRELGDLEHQLPDWGNQRSGLEAQLAAGGADYAALEGLTQQLGELLERIHRGEERWLELSELAG